MALKVGDSVDLQRSSVHPPPPPSQKRAMTALGKERIRPAESDLGSLEGVWEGLGEISRRSLGRHQGVSEGRGL